MRKWICAYVRWTNGFPSANFRLLVVNTRVKNMNVAVVVLYIERGGRFEMVGLIVNMAVVACVSFAFWCTSTEKLFGR